MTKKPKPWQLFSALFTFTLALVIGGDFVES